MFDINKVIFAKVPISEAVLLSSYNHPSQNAAVLLKEIGERINNTRNLWNKQTQNIYLKFDQYLVQRNFYMSVFIFLHFSCPPHFRLLFSNFVNPVTYNGKRCRVEGSEVQLWHCVAQLLNCTRFCLEQVSELTHILHIYIFIYIFNGFNALLL